MIMKEGIMDYARFTIETEITRLSQELAQHVQRADETAKRIDELHRALGYLGSIEESDGPATRAQRRPYTIEETLEIVRLRDELKMPWTSIGLILDRNPSSASGQYSRYKNGQV